MIDELYTLPPGVNLPARCKRTSNGKAQAHMEIDKWLDQGAAASRS